MLRLLLLAYPKSFRDTLGADALRLLRNDLDELRARSPLLFPIASLRPLADFTVQGVLRRVDLARSASEGLRSGWLQDLRLALRASAQRPTFALVSICSLAIGVAVNGVMFSITDTLFLRAIPGVDEPDRVLEVGSVRVDRLRFSAWAYADFERLRDEAPLTHVALYDTGPVNLQHRGEGRQVLALFTTSGYFESLGVELAMGRTFTREEEVGPGEHAVAILSHRTWVERLGADPDALGRTIRVNREQYTIVGVAPEAFTGHTIGVYPALWLPITQHRAARADPERFFHSRSTSWASVVARMGPNTGLDEVNAALATIFARLEAEHPDSNRGRRARAALLGMAPADARAAMAATFAVITLLTLLVLAATCANVAGMLLARAAAREQEIAIRAALGSGRTRLVRHLMTEAMVVFALGGAGGVWLARRALLVDPNAFLPVAVPIEVDFTTDWRLGLFGLTVTALTGLVFGLLPALQVTRRELSTRLRDPAGGTGRRAGRLRRVFVGGQIAVAVLLLGTSVPTVRSVLEWADLEPRIDIEGVYLVSFDLALEGYDRERGTIFVDELLSHLRARPQIATATIATEIPLDGRSSSTPVWPDGRAGERWVQSHYGSVAAGYFDALGIDVLQGRPFTREDRAETERVAIVNESLAREAWPDGHALGRTVELGLDPVVYTVVGVVADTRADGITDRRTPQVFTALAQDWGADLHLAVRRAGSSEDFGSALRRDVLAVDPALALSRTRSLESASKVMLLPHRIMATAASTLGLLALLLCALGLYGVIAFAVTQQTREIGVRIALGAGRPRVIGRVLGRGLVLSLPGIGVGVLLSVGVGQIMQGILPVRALDPITYTTTLGILAVVIVCACVAPAWRAASVRPMEALRFD